MLLKRYGRGVINDDHISINYYLCTNILYLTLSPEHFSAEDHMYPISILNEGIIRSVWWSEIGGVQFLELCY